MKITQDDVWGTYDDDHHMIDKGMMVARGYGEPDEKYFPRKKYEELTKVLPDICPVWKDKLPYKSVTVICEEKDLSQVLYWLSYVHGGEYDKTKELPGGKVAIRSHYQAW